LEGARDTRSGVGLYRVACGGVLVKLCKGAKACERISSALLRCRGAAA
jgi:hypothetical protein